MLIIQRYYARNGVKSDYQSQCSDLAACASVIPFIIRDSLFLVCAYNRTDTCIVTQSPFLLCVRCVLWLKILSRGFDIVRLSEPRINMIKWNTLSVAPGHASVRIWILFSSHILAALRNNIEWRVDMMKNIKRTWKEI